jgi:hypothetical protein
MISKSRAFVNSDAESSVPLGFASAGGQQPPHQRAEEHGGDGIAGDASGGAGAALPVVEGVAGGGTHGGADQSFQ